MVVAKKTHWIFASLASGLVVFGALCAFLFIHKRQRRPKSVLPISSSNQSVCLDSGEAVGKKIRPRILLIYEMDPDDVHRIKAADLRRKLLDGGALKV